MYLSGFADEAADGIEGQIRATHALGWNHIEARKIDGTNLHDLSDVAFDRVHGALQDAGVKVNCLGSTIANWGRHIDEPMVADLEQAQRAIDRAGRLGAPLVRIMSYAVLHDRSPEDQRVEERIERLRRLTAMFLDAGIQPVHENCNNYGGMGWSYTLLLLDKVPGLKLAFDTGNPVFTPDRTKPEPFPHQSAWEFYEHVRESVVHLHIKDGRRVDGRREFCWPGDGDGDVRRICADLVARGYDGGLSIEPHLKGGLHDPGVTAGDEARWGTYVEYGRRMEALLRELGATLVTPDTETLHTPGAGAPRAQELGRTCA